MREPVPTGSGVQVPRDRVISSVANKVLVHIEYYFAHLLSDMTSHRWMNPSRLQEFAEVRIHCCLCTEQTCVSGHPCEGRRRQTHELHISAPYRIVFPTLGKPRIFRLETHHAQILRNAGVQC